MKRRGFSLIEVLGALIVVAVELVVLLAAAGRSRLPSGHGPLTSA